VSFLVIAIVLLGVLCCQGAQPLLRLPYRRIAQLREVTGAIVSYPDLGEKRAIYPCASLFPAQRKRFLPALAGHAGERRWPLPLLKVWIAM